MSLNNLQLLDRAANRSQLLKIVEKAYSNHPIRMIAKPGVKLIAGYACTLVKYNNILVCDICRPGQFPFGIIGSTRNLKKLSFEQRDMVPIWHQRMIFKTDNFEDCNYGPGDKLYVGDSGMLTNESRFEGDSFVARLTGYPDERRSYYEALWL